MCCCNNVYHSCTPVDRLAKERDELKRVLVQREKELKGANAACGELMGKVEELQALDKKREAAHIELMHRLDEEKERNYALRKELSCNACPSGNKIPYADRRDVYSDARTLYGEKHQCMKAIEEMSELTKELAKGWFSCESLNGVIEEIADVTIMLEQLRLMFGINDKVCAAMDDKIDRLRERIAQDAE